MVMVLAVAGCSTPNPGYLDQAAPDRGSLDRAGDAAPVAELGRDGRRPDAVRLDGPRADRRSDGRPPDTRRPDGQPPDTRPPDTRPPDASLQVPDGPGVVACGAVELVATGTLGEPSSAHIALDGAGNPHVVYIKGTEVRHAARGAGVWTSDLVSPASSPSSPRVAFFKPTASLEHIEVAYDNLTTSAARRVFHRWRSPAASGWSTAASIDTSVDAEGIDMAAGGALRIVASGTVGTGGSAFNGYRGWQPVWGGSAYTYPASFTVNNGNSQAYHPRVGVGPTHAASTIFLGGAVPVWQVRRESGAGTSTTSIPAAGFIQAPAAVSVGSAGGVHLAFAKQNFPQPAGAGLFYAFWSGGAAPQQQSLGSATYSRLAVDIDLDGWEQPHVVYVEVGLSSGAKWVRRQGTTWSQPVTVSPGGVAGVRLAVDGPKRTAHFVLEHWTSGQYSASYRSCTF
jgi:hypothetical protein